MDYKEVISYLNHIGNDLKCIARNSDHAEGSKLIAQYVRAVSRTMEIVDELGRKGEKRNEEIFNSSTRL